jgi:hypothetical protein
MILMTNIISVLKHEVVSELSFESRVKRFSRNDLGLYVFKSTDAMRVNYQNSSIVLVKN